MGFLKDWWGGYRARRRIERTLRGTQRRAEQAERAAYAGIAGVAEEAAAICDEHARDSVASAKTHFRHAGDALREGAYGSAELGSAATRQSLRAAEGAARTADDLRRNARDIRRYSR